MKYNNRWKKRMLALTLSGVLMTGVVQAPMTRAEAVDAWAAAAQALGVLGAYKSSLSSILAMGNNVSAQVQSQRQDIEQNGIDPNRNDVQVVDFVMDQLVHKGDYVLKANSLPFCWTVNNSSDFNAACYPTNYVSINKALVRGLNLDPDELAAVLAHEMTHGLEQHSAHNYAKAVAQYYGMSFLNMDTGVMDWNKLNALANYSIAKNVTLPTEYDADEGGFYIMTSAGFNPGGGAAAMARMAYYLTYQTKNVMEYQDLDPQKKDQENYNDHPDTDLREIKLAQMMSDYGCGHVTVKNRRDIYLDGQKLLSVDWTGDDYDNTTENAYYVAGALAKAFHDYDSAAGWNFRTKSDGLVTCLDDSRVNEALHAFLDSERAGERLRELVLAAYAGEAENGARAKMKAAEAKRKARLQQAREAVSNADGKAVKKMRENSDAYSDYGQAEKAIFEITRVFAAKNPENEAENYAVRGRAKAVGCDFAGALKDCDKAVAMDAKNVFNFLNRADVYRMMGDTDKALADLAMAKKIKADNPYGWLLSAEIYDELGRQEEAQENYQKLYALDNKYVRVIPDEYLPALNEKEYKKRLKAKAEARKQYEKKWKEDKKKADKKSATRKTVSVP